MSHNDSRFLPEVLPADVRQAELVDLVARFTPSDGIHETAVTRLQLIRASAPAQGLPSVYEPGLVFVVQGRKQAMLGGEVYRYDPLNYLVISVALPVVGRILEATPDKPYLCVRLNIDPRELAALVFEADASAAAAGKRGHGTLATTQRGVHVARVSDPLMDAVLRLLRLLRAPADAAVLAPLAVREIYYRVLTGELARACVRSRWSTAMHTASHA
jgi:hypothetical protein